jgi:hypothetical protein
MNLHPINESILNLYQSYRDGSTSDLFDRKIPMFYGVMAPRKMLIIGANPSFPKAEEQHEKIIKWSAELNGQRPFKTKDDFDAFFGSRDDLDAVDKNTAVRVQELFVLKYKNYFHEKLDHLAYAWGQDRESISFNTRPWNYIDVFQSRITKLDELKRRILKEGRSPKVAGTTFLKESVKMACELVLSANPEVIVVLNAYSCKVLTEHASDLFPPMSRVDVRTGAVHSNGRNGQLRDVRIFYTSMVTGQRAIDLGSYLRLQWSIAHASGRLAQDPSWKPVLPSKDDGETAHDF